MNEGLIRIGWRDQIAKAWSELTVAKGRALEPGRVIVVSHDQMSIAVAANARTQTVAGRFSGHLPHSGALAPTTGDWVALERMPNSDAVVHAILPRYSELARRAITGSDLAQKQVLAANVDAVFVVAALDGTRNFNLRKIERYLTAVWDGGALPVLLLNKADLAADVEAQESEAASVAVGVDVYAVSAIAGTGLEHVAATPVPVRRWPSSARPGSASRR